MAILTTTQHSRDSVVGTLATMFDIGHRDLPYINNFVPEIASPTCTECVVDCHDAACAAQCTDQCVIVACDDPNHSGMPCMGDKCDALCDADPNCSFSQDIPGGHQSYPSILHPDHPYAYDESLEAFLCSCGDIFSNDEANMSAVSAMDGAQSQTYPSSVFSTPSGPQSLSSALSSPPSIFNQASPFQPQAFIPQTQSNAVTCMWNNCHANFSSLPDLVGHVNVQHLRLQPVQSPTSLATLSTNPFDLKELSCQWDDCNDYPSAQAIPGSSQGTSIDEALNVLVNHLLHDHLGLQQPLSPMSAPLPPPYLADHHFQAQSSTQDCASIFAPTSHASTSGPMPAMHSLRHAECEECAVPAHVCHWLSCNAVFESTDELTMHVNTTHVGSGKAHYDCYWEGCARNGDKGFSSKQKICRHVQSHTGHRPFECSTCKQTFSEAATLQQHMRRHTQEKPYVCDHPGCGKAFAIAGALTIHKRTHNGHKPFKCTYCDRAFSESSNLSKHLRTHTGVRPYVCSEAGCAKAFSRPDQLARHVRIHKK